MYDMPVYFDAHYFFFNLTTSASEPRAVFFSCRVTPALQASCFLLAQQITAFSQIWRYLKRGKTTSFFLITFLILVVAQKFKKHDKLENVIDIYIYLILVNVSHNKVQMQQIILSAAADIYYQAETNYIQGIARSHF